MSFTDPQTVADLLPPPTLPQVKAFLLAYLSTPQNPVNDWESGAALRTMYEMESLLIADLSGNFLGGLVANGYADSAGGTSLARVAHGWYEVDGATPTVATQTVTIACDAAHGPYSSAQVGALIGVASDGTPYLVTTTGAIAPGGTQTIVFTATSPGAARAVITSLSNNLPGISIAAAAITTFGSNGDGDATVQAACAARWPDLLALPEQDRLITWAIQAAGSAVTRFRLDADPAFPGGVLLTLGSSGSVSGGTVTLVQNLLNDLSPVTDVNTAQAATNKTITANGVVTLRSDLIPAAQAASNAAWVAYLAGSQIGAKVFLEALNTAVGDAIKMDPFSNFTGQSLTGAGGDGNVALTSNQQPVPGGTLASELTWNGT